MIGRVKAAHLSAWLFAIVLASTGLDMQRAFACTEPYDDLVVTQDTEFCPGNYRVRDRAGDGVIKAGAPGIVLDGNGMTLNGKNSTGYGIVVVGQDNVTIKNFTITKFHYALRIESSDGAQINGNTLHGNGGVGEQFYDINRPFSGAYGGGILTRQSHDGSFRTNTGFDQNVGIDLYESSSNDIMDNDFSNNFGWGIRLYESSFNTIARNLADHVHGCRGSNCSARDTAGILLVSGSDGNTIEYNSFVDGGDGFFIGNENGFPSNGNLVEGNDCSFAVHNAIEATFSEGNTFRGNTASNSAFGFWLGFSHHSEVVDNIIRNNGADGINWEHGRYGTIRGNDVTGNAGSGLVFTLNPNHPLISQYLGSEAAHDHTVEDNSIVDNGANGIRLLNTTDSSVVGNLVAGNSINLRFEGASTGVVVHKNDLSCGSPSGRSCQLAARNEMPEGNDVNAERNSWGTDVENEIDALVLDGADDPSRGLIDYDPWLAPSTGDCGDGLCSPSESSSCTCPKDCATELLCTDGMDDDCDGLVDCNDPDCAGACLACNLGGESCQEDADCCTRKCKGSPGNRRCR